MKNLTLIILVFIIFLSNLSHSQTILQVVNDANIELKNGSYRFTQNIPKKISPQLEGGNQIDIKSGRKIVLLYEKNGLVYFKYWSFGKSTPNYLKFNVDSNGDDRIFNIDKAVFQQITSPLYNKFKGVSVGAYAVPFRLRGIGGGENSFDFESSLSLQANFVCGFGSIKRQESWFDASVGFGLTGVSLNNKNSTVIEDRTATAFTISLGAVIKPHKFANIGLFIGWDNLNQKDDEVKWVFDGKTWIGIGINVSFNELKTEKTAAVGEQ